MSSAEVHDSQKGVALLDPNNTNRDVYGDSAYPSIKFREELKKRGLRDKLNRKGVRGKPLSEKQKQTNKNKSRIRCRVEHVFGAIKQRCGQFLVRTVGISRAATKIGLYCLTYNMNRTGYLYSKFKET